MFGNDLSAKLDAVEGKTASEIELRRRNILEAALGADEAGPRPGSFKDPMALFE